jgi:predicted alpha/beta superfamily hydrolase
MVGPAQAPVVLPDSARFVLSGWDIRVAWPSGPVPAGGFPVLFVLDADTMFATAVEAARMQGQRSEITGVEPTVIVGIGYPGGVEEALRRRLEDYAPSVDGSGGADLFLDFIEHDLKPSLKQRFPIDDGRAALFGHSLGGLCTLYALFTRPASFRSYVAASPSIWWHEKMILPFERRFVPQKIAQPTRLMICVGGLEQSVAGMNEATRERVRQADMVNSARTLAERLREQKPDLTTAYVEFADENHGSVVPAAISRGLRFIFEEK